VTESGGSFYDEFGNRMSLRTLERERAAAAQREAELSKSKGYFQSESAMMGHPLFVRRTSLTSNIAVLSGPCGVGKTALVAAIAEHTGSYIVDVHTGIHRSAANLEKLFREATQARKLGLTKENGSATLDRVREQLAKMDQKATEDAQRKAREIEAAAKKAAAEAAAAAAKARGRKGAGSLTKELVASFFSPKHKLQGKGSPNGKKTGSVSPKTNRKAVADEVVHEMITVISDPGATNGSVDVIDADGVVPARPHADRAPLVLVDSGDITFPDEAGFIPALRRIAEHSKCPVIVTANHNYTEDELRSVYGGPVPQCRLASPPAHVVLFYLAAVLQAEAPQVYAATSLSDLLRFIRSFDSRRSADPRSLLLHLEFLARDSARFEPGLDTAVWCDACVLKPAPRPTLFPRFKAFPLLASQPRRDAVAILEALAAAQIRAYFDIAAFQTAVDPDGCEYIDSSDELADTDDMWSWLKAEWDKRGWASAREDWDAGRPVVTPSRETLTVGLGEPRLRFVEGGWIRGTGESILRDSVAYPRVVEKLVKRRAVRVHVHATAAVEELADLSGFSALTK
jgi:nucleotide-binding universal stress UspA family protein